MSRDPKLLTPKLRFYHTQLMVLLEAEGIKEIFGRLGAIEKSMAAFHAAHGGDVP